MDFAIELEVIEMQPRRWEVITRGMTLSKSNVDIIIPGDRKLSDIDSFLKESNITYSCAGFDNVDPERHLYIGTGEEDKPGYLQYSGEGIGYFIEKIQRKLSGAL